MLSLVEPDMIGDETGKAKLIRSVLKINIKLSEPDESEYILASRVMS
jgi:hypothetical protein